MVVDASALADLLLDLPRADCIRAHIDERGRSLHAPHLLDIEILSSLRRVVASGVVAQGRAALAVIDLLHLSIKRYPHTILGGRIWELRQNFTPYDAVYVALAEQLNDDGVPLLTS